MTTQTSAFAGQENTIVLEPDDTLDDVALKVKEKFGFCSDDLSRCLVTTCFRILMTTWLQKADGPAHYITITVDDLRDEMVQFGWRWEDGDWDKGQERANFVNLCKDAAP